MTSRWQDSLEAAVADYASPMPWSRGELRKAMIARRRLAEEQGAQSQQACGA